jgi:ppGpp synthetase/RelA/SpoT-type nucleotidyltranferase
MDLIDDFIARYRKEYDFYDQAARLVAQALESNLGAAGIRAIVTSRAKSPLRLEEKCRKRLTVKGYKTVDDIYADIPDLAGARVALYFPGERDQVDNVVAAQFVLVQPKKVFPDASTPHSYKKRFSGYWATHYRVQLREAALSKALKRYAEARVEIQVASVLMHAWSEVEHDLVYKPLQGALSEDEYAILDELNGLVMAGEIALERLQRAGEARVAAHGRAFANHYDLASHILNQISAILKGPLRDSALGRIDLLYRFISRLGLNTPALLKPYLDALHTDTERRPIAEQIIDRLLAEDESRYSVYEEVRLADQATSVQGAAGQEPPSAMTAAIGLFLSEWITFERLLRQHMPADDRRPFVPTGRALLGLRLSAGQSVLLERIRRLRNNLVHGIEVPDPADLTDAAQTLKAINEHITGVEASAEAGKVTAVVEGGLTGVEGAAESGKVTSVVEDNVRRKGRD